MTDDGNRAPFWLKVVWVMLVAWVVAINIYFTIKAFGWVE